MLLFDMYMVESVHPLWVHYTKVACNMSQNHRSIAQFSQTYLFIYYRNGYHTFIPDSQYFDSLIISLIE